MAMRETMTQISNPLPNTKLFIPKSRPDLVPRVRLTGPVAGRRVARSDAGVGVSRIWQDDAHVRLGARERMESRMGI